MIKQEFMQEARRPNRTIMSAESFLAGLYKPTADQQWNPNLNWYPVPVFTLTNPIYDEVLFFFTRIIKIQI